MRILMLTKSYSPNIGGVENHIEKLSRELIKKGHCVDIVTTKYSQILPDYEILNNVKVYRINRGIINIWLWLFKNRKNIRKYNVIHCHDFKTFYWYFPIKILCRFKANYITFHGYEGKVPISYSVIFLRKIAEILSQGNICIGEYISKWYKTRADIISYGGVDIPKKINISSKGSVFVGRLEKDTGIMTYIKAIEILKNKFDINLKLDICGEGTLRDPITHVVKKSKLNVKLHGAINDPFIYLNKKFAFVSGYLAILEAMASKKLVFSVYSNNLKKDYLKSMPNHLFVIENSPHKLANKIAYYHNNPEKTNYLINKAYKFAKYQSWNIVAKNYLELWKK